MFKLCAIRTQEFPDIRRSELERTSAEPCLQSECQQETNCRARAGGGMADAASFRVAAAQWMQQVVYAGEVVMEQFAKSNTQMSARATEQKFSMGKVAELIRVHVSTVSRLMDSGKLGYYQIGRRRIVGANHLEQYLSLAERQAKIRSIR